MKSPHEKGKKKKVEKGDETGSKKSQKWPPGTNGLQRSTCTLTSGLSYARADGYDTCTRRSPAGLFRWNALAASACTCSHFHVAVRMADICSCDLVTLTRALVP
jgi:hypothetical protein